MRGRLLASEIALADYEILEMLLFLGIERRDTKPLAKSLINRFGDLAGTLTAAPAALAEAGLGTPAITALALASEAAAHLARPDDAARVALGTWTAVLLHIDPEARLPQGPGLSALLLNSRNQLLGEPSWPDSTPDDTLVREMLRQALDRHATALIVVRNAGTAAPTLLDRDITLHAAMRESGMSLSIEVHDLIVIGRGAWASLRRHRAT